MNVIRIVLLLIFSAWPIVGYACSVIPGPIDFRIFTEFDIVIEAKMVSYMTKPHPTRSYPGRRIGEFHFEVANKYAGFDVPFKKLTAFWFESNFGVPEKWDGPTDVIVGLTTEILPDGTAVVSTGFVRCGEPVIVDATYENMKKVRAVLLERAVQKQNYWKLTSPIR